MSAFGAFSSLALAVSVSAAGWWRGALSLSGAAAATVVGAVTFGIGGPPAGVALVAFFVSGSWLSRRRRTIAGEVVAAKGHRRDATQVLANGGIAAAGAVMSGLGEPRGAGLLIGALAAAAADTWASELGIGSASRPRSIITGKSVAPGTSGGVTRRGWLAAIAGAMVVGVGYAVTAGERGGLSRCVGLAVLAGLLGSAADSVAGATIQALYRCTGCGRLSESPRHGCGAPAEIIRGRAWVTNDVVNVVATSVGGIVGALSWSPRPRATLGRAPRAEG